MGKALDYNIVNINISAAISNQELIIDGAKIIYLSGSQQLNVKLNENSADNIPLNPKERIVWPGRFNKLFFSGGPYPETITLLIASEPDFVLDSSSVNVDTLNNQIQDDSYLYHSASELNAYMVTDGLNVTATNYAGIQLWQRGGLSKRLVVRSIGVNSASALDLAISKITGSRLDVYAPSAVLSLDETLHLKCNNLGPNATANTWKGLNATMFSTLSYIRNSPSSTELFYQPINPLIVNPNEGVIVFTRTAPVSTVLVTAFFEYEEIDI